ncbi:DNA methyltransferase [uncultured Ruminococcus sp.]|jgi:DNA modification methylase|uniref:DNA methyltransferase n=1 Tax=uncultured Ruminococcus sp. TaxID=165186 RepID=UPI00266C3438|nr:DNA methyltransferase [uncultured Ruminococcus sp.]
MDFDFLDNGDVSNISAEEEKKEQQRKKTFNGLCASEWAELSRSVWNDVSSIRQKKHLVHGATFPEKLCHRLIKMYSKKGDLVLDPFLGTGTTVIAAIKSNRNAIGIELTERFFKVANESILEVLKSEQPNLFNEFFLGQYKLYNGDCCEVLKQFDDSSVQLTITSPPYADLIHKVLLDRNKYHKNSVFVNENNATTNLYSNDTRDLGNMDMEHYLNKVKQIMIELFRITKPGGYNAWVVKDFRDTKNKIPYIDLHSKIAAIGEKAGYKYHDLIIWDQNQHRKLVLLGYPSVFYVNQNHSYIVIMRKPNDKS